MTNQTHTGPELPDEADVEDEQHEAATGRSRSKLLLRVVPVLGLVAAAGFVIIFANLGIAYTGPKATQSASDPLEVDGSSQLGSTLPVTLSAFTESSSASVTVTYPDGSTSIDDLQPWGSRTVHLPVAPGNTVSIEVRATSLHTDPKHDAVSCSIQASTDAAAPELHDSQTRHGQSVATCTWTRET